ncbi:MAG TPA: alpha/beta fold hydrolase [Solirubrobacteraceae bacterium]|nr:alpha/beta fold hydrolase [Solirubrobacteraceae bacterium]
MIRHRAGAGDPLLLIHGLGLAWRCWKPVLPALARVHEVVAVDLPGFGDAPPLDATRPTVDALADAVEADLDAEGLDGVHVAGNSLGGWIALELARRGRARSVVAFAPSGLELPAERAYVISLNEGMRLRAKAAAHIAGAVASNPVSRAAVLGPMRTRPWRVPREDAAAEIRDFARCPGFQATLRWTLGARAATGLGDVRVPARICTGTRDVMLGAFTAPRFAAAIPRADFVPLRGCGHVPMIDAPDRVARAITELTAR